AAELRGQVARRRGREQHAVTPPRAVPEPGWREACCLLEEELRGMPEKYRAPLLLCYLEGDTRAQAALKLGWSLRTLERRLRRGGGVLGGRPKRHGIPPPGARLAARVARGAPARPAPPPPAG